MDTRRSLPANCQMAEVIVPAAFDQCESFGQAACAPTSRIAGTRDSRSNGSEPAAIKVGSNGKHRDGEWRAVAKRPVAASRPWRVALDRRFWDRLFQPELSAPVSVRTTKDRPLVCQ